MKLITPHIFSGHEKVTVIFTEANRSGQSGVDFGINTSTKQTRVDLNYKMLLDELGLKPGLLALANQVHGSNIELIETPGIYKNTDGLITKTKGLALGIQVADCAAILVFDPKNRVIGAFHAGWRGAVADIIPKGLKKMESEGGRKENFRVYISPCISKEMFEVGEEVAIQFPDSFVDRQSYSKPHVDLKSFLKHQMTEYGLEDTSIEVSGGCTMQDDRFYSYRREREKAGRMLGLITMNF